MTELGSAAAVGEVNGAERVTLGSLFALQNHGGFAGLS